MLTLTEAIKRTLQHPLRILGAASLVALLMVTPQAALADTGSGDVVTSDDIDHLVRDRMQAHGIPGAAVAVVRGGEVVHLESYGLADRSQGQPVEVATPFLVGSVSKPFTSLAVYQLISDGKLSLDQPVAPLLSPIVEDPSDGFEDVTIEHLLSHTSGLSMADGLAGTMKIHHGDDALQRRIQEIMSKPLKRPPGAEYEYSNAGAVLLAGVVEQVTRTTFADYLTERIFTPLGMDRTFASLDHPASSDLATGHRQWLGRWIAADLPYDPAGVPNGYIGSTARDMAKFMQAHLSGEPADVMPFAAEQITKEPATPTGWDMPLESGHSTGWFVDQFAGHATVSHAGSLGHFTTHVVLAPGADQLGIAVLTNASAFVAAGHSGQYDLSLELTRLLLGADLRPTEPGFLMTRIAPAAVWIGGLAVLAAAARSLLRRRQSEVPEGRRWAGSLLPSAGYFAAGLAVLLAAPLDAARHFYPDVGWGLTATALLAIGWGTARGVLATVDKRDGRNETSTSLDSDGIEAMAEAR